MGLFIYFVELVAMDVEEHWLGRARGWRAENAGDKHDGRITTQLMTRDSETEFQGTEL